MSRPGRFSSVLRVVCLLAATVEARIQEEESFAFYGDREGLP
jgi:hypothetical protein